MLFCGKCGTENPEGNNFCSKCGSALQGQDLAKPNPQSSQTTENTRQASTKEKVFFKGEGELIIRTTKHHGAGRKAASWLLGGPVGYVIVGRDSKRTTKAKGTLIVTDKAIYCAGNQYPFDKIIATTIKGTFQKKVNVTLDKTISAGGRGSGVGGGDRISVEIEISTDDIDALFKGLEQARMANVEF